MPLTTYLSNLLSLRVGCLCLFFFFQAEDGIRDWSVTGVQTCALPICCRVRDAAVGGDVVSGPVESVDRVLQLAESAAVGIAVIGPRPQCVGLPRQRSEERRVGKECRSRWSPYH